MAEYDIELAKVFLKELELKTEVVMAYKELLKVVISDEDTILNFFDGNTSEHLTYMTLNSSEGARYIKATNTLDKYRKEKKLK